jgi:hypothetical protein
MKSSTEGGEYFRVLVLYTKGTCLFFTNLLKLYSKPSQYSPLGEKYSPKYSPSIHQSIHQVV